MHIRKKYSLAQSQNFSQGSNSSRASRVTPLPCGNPSNSKLQYTKQKNKPSFVPLGVPYKMMEQKENINQPNLYKSLEEKQSFLQSMTQTQFENKYLVNSQNSCKNTQTIVLNDMIFGVSDQQHPLQEIQNLANHQRHKTIGYYFNEHHLNNTYDSQPEDVMIVQQVSRESSNKRYSLQNMDYYSQSYITNENVSLKQSDLQNPHINFATPEILPRESNYALQKDELQQFIYTEVQRILTSQSPQRSVKSSARTKRRSLDNKVRDSANYEDFMEAKINQIHQFVQQPRISKQDKQIQALPPSITQSRSDLSKTIHQNMLEQPVDQWKQGLCETVLTPGKIIDTDRNFNTYSKKQLQQYVEILQQDLIAARRQIQSVAETKDQKTSLHELIANHEKVLRKKNYQLMHKDTIIQQISQSCEFAFKQSNSNHLLFLEFYKKLLQVEQRLKVSHQNGERNAAYKIQTMIKDKLDLIVRFDKNQEEINSLHASIKNMSLKHSFDFDQEESVDEFDQEFTSQKEQQIKQLTQNLQQLKNLRQQSSLIQQDEMCKFLLSKTDQGIQCDTNIEHSKIDKLKLKLFNFKEKNKLLVKQLQNQEKILENLRRQQTLNSESFDRADTLFESQCQTTQMSEDSDLVKKLCKKFNDELQLIKVTDINQVKDVFQRTLKIWITKHKLFNEKFMQRGKEYSNQLMEQVNMSIQTLNQINAYTIYKNPNLQQLNVNLKQIFTITNNLKQMIKSNESDKNEEQQMNLMDQTAKLQQIEFDLNFDQSMDERELKQVISHLQCENVDLKEQVQDLKVHNEILSNMNNLNDTKSYRSERNPMNTLNFGNQDNSPNLQQFKQKVGSKTARILRRKESQTVMRDQKKSATKEFFTLFEESRRLSPKGKQLGGIDERDMLEMVYTLAGSIENILTVN